MWDGKGYNLNGNIEFNIQNGKGYIKNYNDNGELEFEGKYINGETCGKGKEYSNYCIYLIFSDCSLF